MFPSPNCWGEKKKLPSPLFYISSFRKWTGSLVFPLGMNYTGKQTNRKLSPRKLALCVYEEGMEEQTHEPRKLLPEASPCIRRAAPVSVTSATLRLEFKDTLCLEIIEQTCMWTQTMALFLKKLTCVKLTHTANWVPSRNHKKISE